MSELDRLAALLESEGIAYSRIVEPFAVADPLAGMIPESPRWNQIIVRDGLEPKLSAVCHFGSYGSREGLIEAWCYSGEPAGWLTAEQALEYFINHGARGYANG